MRAAAVLAERPMHGDRRRTDDHDEALVELPGTTGIRVRVDRDASHLATPKGHVPRLHAVCISQNLERCRERLRSQQVGPHPIPSW